MLRHTRTSCTAQVCAHDRNMCLVAWRRFIINTSQPEFGSERSGRGASRGPLTAGLRTPSPVWSRHSCRTAWVIGPSAVRTGPDTHPQWNPSAPRRPRPALRSPAPGRSPGVPGRWWSRWAPASSSAPRSPCGSGRSRAAARRSCHRPARRSPPPPL